MSTTFTPQQTRELIKELVNGGTLTASQFRALHHRGVDVFSHYEYLGRIDGYVNEEGENHKLHTRLVEFQDNYELI